MVFVNGVDNMKSGEIPHSNGIREGTKIVVGLRCALTSDNNEDWTVANPAHQLHINQSYTLPGSGDEESLLYDVVIYDDRKSNTEMFDIMNHFNKKHSIYGDYSPTASDTLPVTDNTIFRWDGRQEGNNVTLNSVDINGIKDKTIHLIKGVNYDFVCNGSDNNNSILSIVDNYSKKFTTTSSDRLGTYILETTGGIELENWNGSTNRKLVWTPTTSGTYYYYTWDETNNSTKNHGGIIIVYDDEPVLNDIICSNNNKNIITNQALSNGNKVVVSSTQSKQHDYSLYFNKSKLSMTLPNNMKGFSSDINSIQFYAYITNNSETNSVLFSQGQDILLEVEKTTIDLANDLPNEANNIGQYDLNV